MSEFPLFPVFIRMDRQRVLVVGGGYTGLEKVTNITKHCSPLKLIVLAPEIRPELVEMAGRLPFLELRQKAFEPSDLAEVDLVIAATSIKKLNFDVRNEAKLHNLLVNVADTPDLCDFYLGSVVTKGDLQIGISTNGKSPTFAKRFREFLEENLPEGIQQSLDSLNQIREKLRGDFEEKVKKLNEITAVLKSKKD